MAPAIVMLGNGDVPTTLTPQTSVKSFPNKGHKHSTATSYDQRAMSQSTDISQQYGSRRKMRIAVIGAGASGLNIFKAAEEKLSNVEIVCYEKNHDIGGTWLENRYPGCACDIPSVTYQFSWRRRPWTKYYSESPEIWSYLKDIERENNFIDKYVKLRHNVVSASWSDSESKWTLIIKNLVTGQRLEDRFDFVINGGGVLNKWKWPDIPGLLDFKGKLVHSASYPEGYDLRGKRVALIGAGSSAVQILPNIYDQVSEVYTWVRSPIWIAAAFGQQFAGENGGNFVYSKDQQAVFSDPDRYLRYCKMIEDELNQRYQFIINGSDSQKEARRYSTDIMTNALKAQPELLAKIMPTEFDVGCRRPTPGNGYLEVLTSPKTTVYTSQPGQITARGFIDPSGVEHEVDVIICATGFDTSFNLQFPLLVNGEDKRAAWQSTGVIPSYLSLGYADVPNYLVFLGPYAPVAHGSNIPIIEAYTTYAVELITKMQIESIVSMRPKPKASQQFLDHAREYLKRTAWTGPCSSWFKGGKKTGTPALFPGSRLSFLKLIEVPRYEDFEIVYEDAEDMFAFLKSGFQALETDGTDISWYLGAVKHKHDLASIKEQMDGRKGQQIRHTVF